MKDFRELIERWDSIGDFASDMGLKYSTAQVMKHRNWISDDHWPKLLEVCRKRGHGDVTKEALGLLHVQRVMQKGKPDCSARHDRIASAATL